MNNTAKRASIYLGIFMAVVMVAGAIVPLFTRNTAATTDTTAPTATVLPTFPPPPADFSTIKFDKVYLHPSGIFSIGQPDGWNASQPNKGTTIAQVNLVNNTMLSVVDSYVEASDTPITADQLSDHFSQSVIAASWSNFTTFTESERRMQNDRLVIDFTVTLSGRTYVARQVAWTDGTWIYVVRVLVPENATDFLRYLLDNFVQSLQPQTEFKGTPFNWDAYYDPDANHIIRYPSDWQITDSAPGRPTSITAPDGTLLRVEARANITIADEAAARSFVEGERSRISVVSVQPVQRDLGQGFSVAYSYTTVDGSTESGLSVLLNAPDGKLHIANLLFPESGVDLNSISQNTAAPEATAEATSAASAVSQADRDLAMAMGTFYVIQPLNLSAQSMPATPTPIPTITPTPAPTEESTAEATSLVNIQPGATLELTFAPPAQEQTMEATAETTAEATAAP